MNSCELVSIVTAISCAIAKCVPAEDLSLISAVFGQISCTLTTIIAQEELNQQPEGSPEVSGKKPGGSPQVSGQNPEPVQNPVPGGGIITQGYATPE